MEPVENKTSVQIKSEFDEPERSADDTEQPCLANIITTRPNPSVASAANVSNSISANTISPVENGAEGTSAVSSIDNLMGTKNVMEAVINQHNDDRESASVTRKAVQDAGLDTLSKTPSAMCEKLTPSEPVSVNLPKSTPERMEMHKSTPDSAETPKADRIELAESVATSVEISGSISVKLMEYITEAMNLPNASPPERIELVQPALNPGDSRVDYSDPSFKEMRLAHQAEDSKVPYMEEKSEDEFDSSSTDSSSDKEPYSLVHDDDDDDPTYSKSMLVLHISSSAIANTYALISYICKEL